MGASRAARLGRRWWLWFLMATLLLAWFEGFARPAMVVESAPTGRAEWIWADVEPDAGWVGFFAVRDFSIDHEPTSRVRLLVTADEEYVVFLNGHVVGTGGFQPRAPLSAYDVTPILVEGENRLLVELRSSRSVGGLLLSLTEGESPIVVSDASWGVIGEYREDLKWPGEPTGETSAVKVWGRPTAARWGRPRAVTDRPRLRQQLVSRRPLPAAAARLGSSDEKWHSLPPEPVRDSSLGRWVTFDFGREVSGFVNVALATRGGARGLFWIGTGEPPDPRTARPTGPMLAMVGQGSWTDAEARRFRYVTVVSLAEVAGGRAFLLTPELESELVAPEPERNGVLGLEPPVLRSPVEDEFWSEFESSAGVGIGEDL